MSVCISSKTTLSDDTEYCFYSRFYSDIAMAR